MGTDAASKRLPVPALRAFALDAFLASGVPDETADLAVQSLIDASLMGVDSHGIEALEMYVDHLRAGGLRAQAELIQIGGDENFQLWDMQDGFGLAGGRRLMGVGVDRARKTGIYLATCRNTNHLGACGVYGKIAADQGLIGIVSQQALASLAPWGGREVRVGSSPLAFVAPVAEGFPFYFDGSMAAMNRATIKQFMRAGQPLPAGTALDADGAPTTDAEKAWHGQIMPIGGHKGVGLAMVLEVLSAVLSGNRLSGDIHSIVNTPGKSAGSSFLMLVIDPQLVMPRDEFARAMRRYAEYIESSAARDSTDPPRYPGRQEGENWCDRVKNGIPVSTEALQRFETIAQTLEIAPVTTRSG